MAITSGDNNLPPQPGTTGGLQITYKETGVREGASPNETFGWDQSTAKRSFLVDWKDRKTAVWQILGYPTANPTAPLTSKITRYLPEKHPTFPWLVASKISAVKGLGTWKVGQTAGLGAFDPLVVGASSKADPLQYELVGVDKVARYQYAQIDVEYEIPDYPVVEDAAITFEYERFTSFKYKPNGDYLTLPVGFLGWAAGPNGSDATKLGTAGAAKPIPGSIGKIVQSLDILATWQQVPYECLPLAAINLCLGKVNHKTFFGQPPHTLLLTAADIKRLRTPYGTWAWEIAYTIKLFAPEGIVAKPGYAYVNGHNSYFDFNGGNAGAGSRTYYPATLIQTNGNATAYTPGTQAVGTCTFDETDFAALWGGVTP